MQVQQNMMVEFSFNAKGNYADPFNTITLDAIFTDPTGKQYCVPCFWAGDNLWKVRYASGLSGCHTFVTKCSAADDSGLHDVTGEVEIIPYEGDNPLYLHGPVGIAKDRRHFAHADGTPFFWLGDTWWMWLCSRIKWPEDFARLTADRIAKNFNVVQIVAGLYPDMPAFDPRGVNEAGYPWAEDYSTINPAYFDMADRRLMYLVENGISPCLVGAWGYFIPWMGVEKLQQHWRNLIARYGALPIFWCVAGEANLPYYLAPGFPYDDREQVRMWTEVARYVRQTDPYHRPISIHPTGLGRLSARGAIDDSNLLDFDMLQPGHGTRDMLPPSIDTLLWSLDQSPEMPVINSEVAYEALTEQITADFQRLVFWASMLSGAAGQTYGANGIWQANQRDVPHGPSPHGGNYGNIPWDEAMDKPGSTQMSICRNLLGKYDWYRFESHPEWACYTNKKPDTFERPYAAGLPSELRIIYIPEAYSITLRELESGITYSARYFDPVTGETTDLGQVQGDCEGKWQCAPPIDIDLDWVIILEVC